MNVHVTSEELVFEKQITVADLFLFFLLFKTTKAKDFSTM